MYSTLSHSSLHITPYKRSISISYKNHACWGTTYLNYIAVNKCTLSQEVITLGRVGTLEKGGGEGNRISERKGWEALFLRSGKQEKKAKCFLFKLKPRSLEGRVHEA